MLQPRDFYLYTLYPDWEGRSRWEDVEVQDNELCGLRWLEVDLSVEDVSIDQVRSIIGIIHYNLEGIQT